MAVSILVIEDNALARFTMREILEDAGYEVAEAETGDQGIELQNQLGFDLVVTDIIMPKKDGLDTIAELKGAYPHLPVVAVSGGGRTRDCDILDAAREAGADRVLHKPFTNEELVEIAASLLDGRT